MGQRVKQRRDTGANWTSTNPVLADGEFGFDKTNKVLKIGDGVSTWTQLANLISNNQLPVGSIHLSVVATNPNTTLGYGTWIAWGAGRVPVSLDAAQTEFTTVEQTGGEKTHLLTTAEMPSHSHAEQSLTTGSTQVNGLTKSTTSATVQVLGVSTGLTGGGAAHNVLQPYIVCYMWKRTA